VAVSDSEIERRLKESADRMTRVKDEAKRNRVRADLAEPSVERTGGSTPSVPGPVGPERPR